MALSNLRNEPRRELTESAIGLSVFAALFVLLFFLGRWVDPTEHWAVGMVIAFLCLLFGSLLTIGVLALSHVAGEVICDVLQDRGIHLRPRKRYFDVQD